MNTIMADSKRRSAAEKREDENVEQAEAARKDKVAHDEQVAERQKETGQHSRDPEATDSVGKGHETTPVDRSVASVAVGPHGEHEGANSTASPEQARRSNLASTSEELDQVAEQVAQSVLPSIAPARAREEAKAAQVRAGASDPAQSRIEARLAELLNEVADRHEAAVSVQSERQRLLSGDRSRQITFGVPSGPLGRALPADVKRGSAVVVHQPEGTADFFGFVTRLWPAVLEDPDNDKSKRNRWRADIVYFAPQNNGVGNIEGASYGTGVDQFELVSELDEDDEVAVERRDRQETPWRHDIR